MKNEDMNKNLMEYENLERQLEGVVLQKHQFQLQLTEFKRALEELKKLGTKDELYRNVGSIFLHHTNKETAEKDLKEKVELSEVRLNGLAKQEEKLRATVMEAYKRLQEKMKEYEK